MARLGRQKDVTYLNLAPKFRLADGSLKPDVLEDWVHPGAVGYQILADNLIGPVKAALRR